MSDTFTHKFGGWREAEARRHTNPDGSVGGIVAASAAVPASITLPSNVEVWPDAKICDGASIGGRASIGDGASIGYSASIIDFVVSHPGLKRAMAQAAAKAA